MQVGMLLETHSNSRGAILTLFLKRIEKAVGLKKAKRLFVT